MSPKKLLVSFFSEFLAVCNPSLMLRNYATRSSLLLRAVTTRSISADREGSYSPLYLGGCVLLSGRLYDVYDRSSHYLALHYRWQHLQAGCR
jgi:hypothetical protein